MLLEVDMSYHFLPYSKPWPVGGGGARARARLCVCAIVCDCVCGCVCDCVCDCVSDCVSDCVCEEGRAYSGDSSGEKAVVL